MSQALPCWQPYLYLFSSYIAGCKRSGCRQQKFHYGQEQIQRLHQTRAWRLYHFLERHAWHYNSTRSEADNLNNSQAWRCSDDLGKPIGSDQCKDMPAGGVKAFMQFVENSTDKLLFEKVVQLQDEMGQHHSVKQWFQSAYNNGKPSPSATTDHTDSEMKAMLQDTGNNL